MSTPKSIARHIVQTFKDRVSLTIVYTMLCVSTSLSQNDGFFHIYEYAENGYIPSCICETSDGHFLVAAWDDNHHDASVLFELSENGEVLNKVSIGNSEVSAFIDGIFHDSIHNRQYYAIGSLRYWDEQCQKPFVLHFDDHLHLNGWYEVELPGTYTSFVAERAIMTRDGDFLFATSLDAQDGYHRLYMKITKDGTLQRFFEATEDCRQSNMINAIFEFPVGERYGDYRSSSQSIGDIGVVMRLFDFDHDWVSDTLNEYPGIEQQVGNSNYFVGPSTYANGSAMLYGDSCLLLVDRASEAYAFGSSVHSDRSTMLTTTDLEGNILRFTVLGSMNDTAVYPIPFNAIDIMKTDEELIYTGCFGTSNGSFPSEQRNHVTMCQLDSDFNIRWKKTIKHQSKYLMPSYLLASSDGGCIIVGATYHYGHYDWFALKINPEGSLNCNEVLVEDVRPYAFYPNPAHDQLRLQYTPDVEPAQIELYDLQGRLIRSQRQSLQSLDMSQLPSGTYTMRVVTKDGQTFSDKIVKE